MTSSLIVRVEADWEALAPLREQWNELAARALTSSVFQTFEWHDAWWRAFGADAGELRVAAAFERDRLVAIAPMHAYRRRGRTIVGFLGNSNGASDYCDFITADAGLVAPLLDAVLAGRGWDVLDLGNVPAASEPLRAAAAWADARGHRTLDAKQYPAPARILGDAEADRAVLNKKSLKRHFNGFAKAGDLRFHHSTDAAEVAASLEDFFRQHVERWALAGIDSQFADPRQKIFYRLLAPALLERGWLRFAIVRLDDRAIAYHFGFEYGDRFIWYKPTFDASLVKKSPGEVLLKFLLEDAIGRGLAEFDFTVGDEDFKYRFSNVVRETRRFRLYRSAGSWRADRLEGWLRRRARAALDRIRSGPEKASKPADAPEPAPAA